MLRPKIIVAGYGSWAKASENPAEAIAMRMGTLDWAKCEVVPHMMPVRSDTLVDNISDLLDTHRPDAWIGIGVSSQALLQAETVGINWCDFDVPDAAGLTLNNTQIAPGGTAAYEASLPNAEIVEALIEAGIPAAVSYHAGTHLCNHMLYSTARLIEQKKLRTLTGFIHVPRSPANILEHPAHLRKPSMNLKTMYRAMELCINTTTRFIQDRRIKTA